MKTSLNFRVQTADEDVVVTLDGTNCMVRYVKADTGLNLYHVRGDERAPIHDILAEEALDGKRKPRAAVPWACRYAFPRLRRANLTHGTREIHALRS